MKKNVVVISYSTYPRNNPRSLRTDELVKELSRKGHNVTLYVLTGTYNYRPYEEATGVTVKSLGDTIFFDFDPLKGESLTYPSKVIRKLFKRYSEYPFITLVKNTYQALHQEDNIDLLITIAFPYPLHWGTALFRTLHADKLKNTIWVADCGDPYMGNALALSSRPFYFKYVEKWFCKEADFITIPVETAKQAYYPEFHDKIRVIPQGFNFDTIEITNSYKKNPYPTFIYAGNFYLNFRDPSPLLDYLANIDIEFKFIVYTKTPEFLEEYKNKLGSKLIIKDFIPRENLIYEMSKADFLINLENPSNVQSPSKLIDYALSKRPILSLNTNESLDIELVNQFLNYDYTNQRILEDIDQYDIKKVADKFVSLLDETVVVQKVG